MRLLSALLLVAGVLGLLLQFPFYTVALMLCMSAAFYFLI